MIDLHELVPIATVLLALGCGSIFMLAMIIFMSIDDAIRERKERLNKI